MGENEKPKFLSLNGFRTLVTYFKNLLSGKVDKESGKSLVDDAEIQKLSTISQGAEPNVIEEIFLNGVAQTVDARKAVNLNVKEIDVDATLSQQGMAADAKATGDALNDAIKQIIGEFDEGNIYMSNDLCLYNGHIYRCNLMGYQAVSGSFNPSNWDEVTLYDVFFRLTRYISSIADVYNSERQYVAGDLVFYNVRLYRCVNDTGENGEQWTPAHWERVNLQDIILYATPTIGDVGKALMPKTISEGKVTEWEFGEAGKVDDVKIDGVSIVSNKIANIPAASSAEAGLVKINPTYGISIDSSHVITINSATSSEIKAGDSATKSYKPITPETQHRSVFYGLAKAAGDSTQSASQNAIGTYTDEAKSAIQTMLGIDGWNLSDRIAKGTGIQAIIAGDIAHNRAIGTYAFAEGYGTSAIGNNGSHAEGFHSVTVGNGSHAEGYYTNANGLASHAEGFSTVSNGQCEHVFGMFNIESSVLSGGKSAYVEVVGNGTTPDNRSNARTLDWNGNEVLKGKLTVGTAPTDTMDVTTKGYVDTAIVDAISGITGLEFKIVNALPATGEKGIIYLVPKSSGGGGSSEGSAIVGTATVGTAVVGDGGSGGSSSGSGSSSSSSSGSMAIVGSGVVGSAVVGNGTPSNLPIVGQAIVGSAVIGGSDEDTGDDDNIYYEYIYVNNRFERIGSTEVDLSGYLSGSDIASDSQVTTMLTEVFPE